MQLLNMQISNLQILNQNIFTHQLLYCPQSKHSEEQYRFQWHHRLAAPRGLTLAIWPLNAKENHLDDHFQVCIPAIFEPGSLSRRSVVGHVAGH